MKGFGFITGTLFSSVIRLIYKIIKEVCKFLTWTIYYFGLYVPIAFLIFGGILQLIFKFQLFDLSTNSLLYIFGLSLSIACALIIGVKNLIIKPLRKFSYDKNIIEYSGGTAKNKPEAPVIYKSRVNKGIIVYEYANRYDLYEETEDGLSLVETEYKNKRQRRW